MESMAYLTAGTLDAYEQPDLSLEAAIVKVSLGNTELNLKRHFKNAITVSPVASNGRRQHIGITYVILQCLLSASKYRFMSFFD